MNSIIICFFMCIALVASFTVQRTVVPSISTSKLNLFGNPEPKKDNSPKKDDKGGMFGGMGDLMGSMKKAQEIAKQAEVVNKELMETIIVGNDPSSQVYATFNGLGMPIGLKVSDELAAKGGEAVSLASTQAMVDGHTKSQNTMMQRMQALYSGAGVPTA
eukprot:CAMPEP_0119033112 /NCGR_PEP_ID=MMETSP1177-20130426/106_1 /TAXON_ID=2985 /ORGANISM="Ochromonas sp, Strain CCMP1899" /LENGTH=159 /DNA_ID=CAMNT_0006989583 /DNA_START=48 /DNA_END=527 /DNA_ORIENTATION=+